MKRICIFCGSSPGSRPVYEQAAARTGSLLAERGIELVFGGGAVGLMGTLADAALADGGHVIGVIPAALAAREVTHTGLPDLRVVDSMHTRKATMADLADAFVALPGGIGTLEELFEVWTWAQLGAHAKPCGVLDVDGYFQRMIGFIDHMVEERFLRDEHRSMLIIDTDPEALLDRLASYEPPRVAKWIDRHVT